MGGNSSFFAITFVFIWVAAVIGIFVNSGVIKNRKKRNKKDSVTDFKSTKPPIDITRNIKYNMRGSQLSDLDRMEDRDNDWLAEQIREERRKNEVVSDMFALKIEHHDNCDVKRY